jgi:hypothetical protein
MIEVGIATFSGVHAAEHAFAEARDGEPGAGWLGDAAFVEVHRRGRIVVRGTVLGHYVDVDSLGDVIGPDTAGGAVEASQSTEPQGPAFEAIRERVPEGSSAVVVVADPERIRAMYRALFAAADTFVRYRLSPETEAELRAALAETPRAPSARS